MYIIPIILHAIILKCRALIERRAPGGRITVRLLADHILCTEFGLLISNLHGKSTKSIEQT